MLRRRILASAMASVMAIGSIAVVASAEDTAVAEKNVKSKADLEAFVKQFDKFRDDDINDYGSISGDRFIAMCDFAENVLADTDSTVEDYTAAYMMLEATYKSLKVYSASDLKTLIEENKKVYDTNNVMNADYGDAIYADDKGQWTNFANAFEDAQAVVGSSDTRIISDAYEALADAKSKLAALKVVTKTQFRTAMKNLESALQLEYKYDAWRRGTIAQDAYSINWSFESSTYAWGSLYYAVQDKVAGITDLYNDFVERKTISKTTNEDIVKACGNANDYADVLKGFVPDETARGSKSSVQTLLKQYHSLLVHDYATTAADKLAARASVCASDPANHKDVTVAWDTTTNYEGVATAISSFHPSWKGVNKYISASLTVKPAKKMWIITNADGYANIYDASGDFDRSMVEDAIIQSDNKPTGLAEGLTAVAVNKNSTVDLAKYIKVDAADIVDRVTASGDPLNVVDNHERNAVYDGDTYDVHVDLGWIEMDTQSIVGGWILYSQTNGHFYNTDGEAVVAYPTLDKAMQLAEFYLNAKKDDWGASDIYDIDDTGSIADNSAKGSSAEWSLVYRYLKYSLEDKYKGATTSHTKSEVAKLIEDSYDLVDKTGDAAMFSYNHAALVDARQDALEWLKAANKDKKYKDYESRYECGSNPFATSTDAYNALSGNYWQLFNDYNAFNLSFGDVYAYLAKVAGMIDNNDIEATPAILSGLSDVAYKLVTVQSLDEEVGVELLNDAFTTDYYLNKDNRIYTKGGEYYKELDIDRNNTRLTVKDSTSADNAAAYSHNELFKAYTALVDEVKKQTEKVTKLGDVDGDGDVDMLDAKALLDKIVAKEEVDVKIGDFDGNSKVEIADAKAILEAYNKNGNKPL